MDDLLLALGQQNAVVVGRLTTGPRQTLKMPLTGISSDGLKQKQNLGGGMIHPKLDTKEGRETQRRNIERSRERLKPKLDAMRGGDNFRFVAWCELADLKLWVKR